jgi:hypothetical protein
MARQRRTNRNVMSARDFLVFRCFVVFISQKATWDDIRSWVSKDFKTLGRAFHHQAFPLPKVFPSRKGILLSSITFHIKIRGGGRRKKNKFSWQVVVSSHHNTCIYHGLYKYIYTCIIISWKKKKKRETYKNEMNKKKNVYVVFYKI